MFRQIQWHLKIRTRNAFHVRGVYYVSCLPSCFKHYTIFLSISDLKTLSFSVLITHERETKYPKHVSSVSTGNIRRENINENMGSHYLSNSDQNIWSKQYTKWRRHKCYKWLYTVLDLNTFYNWDITHELCGYGQKMWINFKSLQGLEGKLHLSKRQL